MIARLLIVTYAVGLIGASATATDGVRVEGHEALAKIMVTTPTPDYPLSARAKHITGHGIYDIWFHVDTGIVSHVDIVSSTGSKLLDEAAVRGLRQWRARPGLVSHAKVPITFRM